MEDNFFEELFDNSFKDTKEPFTAIFKIENTDLGLQLIALTPIKIDELSLDFGKRIISDNPLVSGVPIFDLQDKYLVGKTHIDSNVFHITGWEDSPRED